MYEINCWWRAKFEANTTFLPVSSNSQAWNNAFRSQFPLTQNLENLFYCQKPRKLKFYYDVFIFLRVIFLHIWKKFHNSLRFSSYHLKKFSKSQSQRNIPSNRFAWLLLYLSYFLANTKIRTIFSGFKIDFEFSEKFPVLIRMFHFVHNFCKNWNFLSYLRSFIKLKLFSKDLHF